MNILRSALVFGYLAFATLIAQASSEKTPPLESTILARVDELVMAMNRGDDPAIAALMTPDAVIQDEVAPYRWLGPRAEAHWSADDGSLIRKRGVTASHSARGKPTFFHHDASHAFIVLPLAYDYTRNAKRQHETGLWTIVYSKTGPVWRVAFLGFAKTSDTSDATWDGR